MWSQHDAHALFEGLCDGQTAEKGTVQYMGELCVCVCIYVCVIYSILLHTLYCMHSISQNIDIYPEIFAVQ